MDNSGNAKLWDQSDSNVIPLRRPKGPSAGETTAKRNELSPNINETNNERSVGNNTVASNQSSSHIVSVSNSRLSADAEEFYPAGYCSNTTVSTPRSYVQDRLNKFKKPSLSGSTQQDSFGSYQDNPFNSEQLNEDNVLVQQDIQRLQHIIGTLTYDPGQFDDSLDLFMDTFKPYFDDINVISTMVKMIFEQVITFYILYSFLLLCGFHIVGSE